MRKMIFAAAMLVACGMSAAANAGPITVDGGWTTFSFLGTGAQAYASGSGDFTFSASGYVELQVSDFEYTGDIFSVVINGVTQALTSPSMASVFSLLNLDDAFLDDRYSHGIYLLGPGNYTVQIFSEYAPWDRGDGGLRVVSVAAPNPAPEPITLALFGAGLAGLGLRRRRKA